jgi:hypothetical protein
VPLTCVGPRGFEPGADGDEVRVDVRQQLDAVHLAKLAVGGCGHGRISSRQAGLALVTVYEPAGGIVTPLHLSV